MSTKLTLKNLRHGLNAVLLILPTVAGAATASVWQQSYQLEAQKRYAEAEDLIKLLTSKDTDSELAWLRVGWLEYLQGQYGKSIAAYRQAVHLNPASLDAHLGMTLPLMAQTRWQEATSESQAALKVAPGNYTAHLRLLSCEYALGQWERLATHAQQLTRWFPAESTPWLYLAYAQYHTGASASALQAYRQVLDREPGNRQALAGIQTLDGE